MAGSSLLALLDDISTILDDVATMTKVAAQKTSGVLGDDLAVNAEQVSGVQAHREWPIVWAVAKGSFVNKLILVPTALALSWFAPWLIAPLLILGGLFLCFEGAEKVLEHWLRRTNAPENSQIQDSTGGKILSMSAEEVIRFEKDKIKGAIRTDFVLSAEIVVITLGTVVDASWGQKATVLALIALIMTVGVYGFVGLIVKIDDFGFWLMRGKTPKTASFGYHVGQALLKSAPYLMRSLGIIGTIAMFMVGGGILSHYIPHWHQLADLGWFVSLPLQVLIGLSAGLTTAGLIHALPHKTATPSP